MPKTVLHLPNCIIRPWAESKQDIPPDYGRREEWSGGFVREGKKVCEENDQSPIGHLLEEEGDLCE